MSTSLQSQSSSLGTSSSARILWDPRLFLALITAASDSRDRDGGTIWELNAGSGTVCVHPSVVFYPYFRPRRRLANTTCTLPPRVSCTLCFGLSSNHRATRLGCHALATLVHCPLYGDTRERCVRPPFLRSVVIRAHGKIALAPLDAARHLHPAHPHLGLMRGGSPPRACSHLWLARHLAAAAARVRLVLLSAQGPVPAPSAPAVPNSEAAQLREHVVLTQLRSSELRQPHILRRERFPSGPPRERVRGVVPLPPQRMLAPARGLKRGAFRALRLRPSGSFDAARLREHGARHATTTQPRALYVASSIGVSKLPHTNMLGTTCIADPLAPAP
ncbi:hypothetical protein FB451DRAFT_1408356 [Mycena latifolia]|nr:hypothetical protein FB451DRAFT_1408356 [Mycena latifolia]